VHSLELIFDCYFLSYHTGLKLDDMNVLNVLHDAGFVDADWELLGSQLISGPALQNIRAYRRDNPNLCLIDTIAQWQRNDLKASWEKLAEAVTKIEKYGEGTAERVRRIVHTCMFFVGENLVYYYYSNNIT